MTVDARPPAGPDGRLRFDAGAGWLDLLATVGGAYGPAPRERLTGLDRLTEWLATERLTPAAAPTEADLARTRALRELLRRLVLAALGDTPPDPAAIEELNGYLAHDRPLALRTDRRQPVLDPPATVEEALARVARQAAEHLSGPVGAELHVCAEDSCAMVFLDPTGRRRWCAANRCGVRARVRAHRARRGSDAG